jgi:DNA-binding MarR family transcriptional regulator
VGRGGRAVVSTRRKPSPALVEQVPRALRCASRSLTTRFRGSLMREGLPFSRFVVLRLLILQGPATSKALSAAMGVTSANMPGLIDHLEKDGLVSRTRNRKDRREILVKATPKGRRRFLRLRDTALDELMAAFDGWTDDELERFLVALKRFAARRDPQGLIELKVLP